MSKIFLLILAVAIVWWLAKGMRRKQPGKSQGEVAPEQMVVCSHCGLYLPKHEAVLQNEAAGHNEAADQNEAVGQNKAAGRGQKFFCSEEHSRLAG